MMRSLYDRVMGPLLHQQRKHEHEEGWAEEFLNRMPREEFLRQISWAIDDMLDEVRSEAAT